MLATVILRTELEHQIIYFLITVLIFKLQFNSKVQIS